MRVATTQAARDAVAATRNIPPAAQLGQVTYWSPQVEADRAYVVLHSPGRHAKTIAIAERKLTQVRPQLQQLQRDVAAGKVRSARTIAERATRILVSAKATPWVRWELTDGAFHWQEDNERLATVRDEGGKYVLQTNVIHLTGQQAALAYRQLEAVENCFRHLKNTLHLRPIYHRNPHRVKGHIGLCVLALFLVRLLEHRLLKAGICATATEALAAANELQAVPVTLSGRELWPTPHITATAAAIFRALDIPDLKTRFVADLHDLQEQGRSET